MCGIRALRPTLSRSTSPGRAESRATVRVRSSRSDDSRTYGRVRGFPCCSPQARTPRIADERGRSLLWTLAEGREAASTKAVATAPKLALLLQASSGSARRAAICRSGAGGPQPRQPAVYLCRSAIVLAAAPASLSATSASRTSTGRLLPGPDAPTGARPLRDAGSPPTRRCDRACAVAQTRARRSASVPSAAQRANEGLPFVPAWTQQGPYRPPCRRSRERPAPCRRWRLRVYLPLAPDADDRDNPDGITHSARCRERLGHFRATNGFDQNLRRIVNISVYRTFVARARRDSNSRPSVP